MFAPPPDLMRLGIFTASSRHLPKWDPRKESAGKTLPDKWGDAGTMPDLAGIRETGSAQPTLSSLALRGRSSYGGTDH
jgi:hypothetical protein